MFAGTCVNCFDEDGDCRIDALPWAHVSDFAADIETSEPLSRDEFLKAIPLDIEMFDGLEVENCNFGVTRKNIVFAYDVNNDIHYLFVMESVDLSFDDDRSDAHDDSPSLGG